MALLTMLAVVTVTIVYQRSLFGIIVLTSVYSFLMATLLIVLDAVDVAMTEAAVGAGVSTVIFLATLHLIKTTEMRSIRRHTLPLFVVIGTGAVLVWGTVVMPPFGSHAVAIHRHVAPFYIADTMKSTNVPNVVTSVLSDYRGYDTLGETTVIFTAGIGVMLLLQRRRDRPEKDRAGQ